NFTLENKQNISVKNASSNVDNGMDMATINKQVEEELFEKKKKELANAFCSLRTEIHFQRKKFETEKMDKRHKNIKNTRPTHTYTFINEAQPPPKTEQVKILENGIIVHTLQTPVSILDKYINRQLT